jgi:hypothetical protein
MGTNAGADRNLQRQRPPGVEVNFANAQGNAAKDEREKRA